MDLQQAEEAEGYICPLCRRAAQEGEQEDGAFAAAGAAAGAATSAVVAEAEGLRLHLSSGSVTGYKGVCKDRGRFQARHWMDGSLAHLGNFYTAAEAAVAYARAVGQGPTEAEVAPRAEAAKRRRRGEAPRWGVSIRDHPCLCGVTTAVATN